MDNSPVSAAAAWLHAIGIWLVGCLVLGWGCFVLVGGQLMTWPDRWWAAVCWQLAFACGLAIVLAAILASKATQKLSLADVGWGKPASRTTLGFGILLGALYVSGVYAGILNDPAMKGVDPFFLHWVRFALAPVGIFMAVVEELLMRGVFMTHLSQARVPVWMQILLSGACSAAYHSFHNPSWIGFLPSFGLFTAHAVLYVAARRSLTPSIVAHSMYHVLCAPYLLMFAMSQASQASGGFGT